MQSCPAKTATGLLASTTAPLRSPPCVPTMRATSPGARLSWRTTLFTASGTPARSGSRTVTEVLSPLVATTAMKPPRVTLGWNERLGYVSTR